MASHETVAKVVVCDAGPLSHLDELDCLDLLADFVDVIIPSAVWTEVEHHRPAALANRKISLRRIVVDFAPSGQMIQSVDDLR